MTELKNGFTDEEEKMISYLGNKLRGTNEPLSHEADRCKEWYQKRSKSRRKMMEDTVGALSAAYRTFLRCERETDSQDDLMIALGVEVMPKKNIKRLIAIIKATVTTNGKYASKLQTIIRYALTNKIHPDRLVRFVKKEGGIAKCIKEYQSAKDKGAKDGAKRPMTLKVLVADKHVLEGVVNVLEEVKKRKEKHILTAKLAFLKDGQIKLKSLVGGSDDWED